MYEDKAVYHQKHGSLETHYLAKNEQIYINLLTAGRFTLGPYNLAKLITSKILGNPFKFARHLVKNLWAVANFRSSAKRTPSNHRPRCNRADPGTAYLAAPIGQHDGTISRDFQELIRQELETFGV